MAKPFRVNGAGTRSFDVIFRRKLPEPHALATGRRGTARTCVKKVTKSQCENKHDVAVGHALPGTSHEEDLVG